MRRGGGRFPLKCEDPIYLPHLGEIVKADPSHVNPQGLTPFVTPFEIHCVNDFLDLRWERRPHGVNLERIASSEMLAAILCADSESPTRLSSRAICR